METLKLIEPTIEKKDAYLSFYEEWKESGEAMIPWVIGKDPADFGQMLLDLHNYDNGIGLEEGFVPNSTYWYIDGHNEVVGAVNIRHALTEGLRNAGGHIGYGIRPSARRKGYATEGLRSAIKIAGELGIERVLVVCDEINKGSIKTILKNNGIADEDFIEEGGNVVKRYWIDTEPMGLGARRSKK